MVRRFTAQLWCTGEDSNLRTSLGGTDLQSVGFNHSPTCAETFGRCGCCASSGTPASAHLRCTIPAGLAGARAKTADLPDAGHSLLFATQGSQGPPKMRRRPLHAGKVPNGVRWKNLLRRYRVRRLPENTISEIRFKTLSSLALLGISAAGSRFAHARKPPQLWSWRRDSNPRPSDYKSDALPTELRQHSRGQMRLRANLSP